MNAEFTQIFELTLSEKLQLVEDLMECPGNSTTNP